MIECIPNISEGRDAAVIQAAADAVRNAKGCRLLHVTSDADHNRSVLTFIGDGDGVMNAAVALARVCIDRIDLRIHRGIHPRMGAIDVIPLVPLGGATMDECITISRRLGQRLWTELRLPVYLYERSAAMPHRANLAHVRAGQFEGLAMKMLRDGWHPDFGDAPHPTAGAVAVGARMPLVAFNVDLDTDDVEIAKAIAAAVREAGGGLLCVKALGLYLGDRGRAQVSMNLVDYTVTGPEAAMHAVEAEAAKWGVGVVGSEIIGLVPRSALTGDLRLMGFDEHTQILDQYLPPKAP